MTNKHAKASASSKSVFSTKGGRSYLDNLQRLHPTDLTRKAMERAEASENAKARKQK